MILVLVEQPVEQEPVTLVVVEYPVEQVLVVLESVEQVLVVLQPESVLVAFPASDARRCGTVTPHTNNARARGRAFEHHPCAM